MRRIAGRVGPCVRPRRGAGQFRGYRQRDAVQSAGSGSGHSRRRCPSTSDHRARRLRRDGQVHAFQAGTRRSRVRRQRRQPPVQPRTASSPSAHGGRRRSRRSGHARRLQGSGGSGHGAACRLSPAAGRHHRAGRHGGGSDSHPTDHRQRTVRPCGRGARRRAGHRPPRNRGQRARALHHHRHGQTRRTGTELRLRCGPHLRGRTGRQGRGPSDADPRGYQDGHHAAARLPVRHHGRGRAAAVADRRRPAPGRQGRRAGARALLAQELLRAVGRELGVPSAAQGPPGGRRPRPRPGLHGHDPAVRVERVQA